MNKQEITNKVINEISQIANKVRYAANCQNCDGVGYNNGGLDDTCGTYACYKIIDLIRGTN